MTFRMIANETKRVRLNDYAGEKLARDGTRPAPLSRAGNSHAISAMRDARPMRMRRTLGKAYVECGMEQRWKFHQKIEEFFLARTWTYR